ncbi:hypothetical protein CVT26_011471 [Gymnopilus dilepis]|uniref:Uncharacterized protein n=1 Tax=Gymnopilus dilepis TaxID=231916 RepID=A0A409W8P6_9AGAR|nr:hypothetical protein CVT26_011471 [Gymnopilus dilepis]
MPTQDFSRVIVEFRFGEHEARATRELAREIWFAVRCRIAPIGVTIAGAEFTPAKNLLITISPPAAVDRFMQTDCQHDLRRYLIGALQLPPASYIWIYIDRPWPRVIIHNVPIQPTFHSEEEALEDLMTELMISNPVIQETPPQVLIRARLMQPFNEALVARGEGSLCIALHHAEHVQRLVRNGAFINGSRHRVSIRAKQFSRR